MAAMAAAQSLRCCPQAAACSATSDATSLRRSSLALSQRTTRPSLALARSSRRALLPPRASSDESSLPSDDDYDPSDFAVSDEAVPDDILETLAKAPAGTPAGTPEFAAVMAPSFTPADVDGDGDGGAFASPGQAAADEEREEEEARRRDLKLTLVDSLFGLERGIRASSEGRAEIAEIVAQLEAMNPVPATAEATSLLDGRWILAYTSFSELLPLLAASLVPLVRVGDIVQDVDTRAATVLNSVTFIGPLSSTTLEATATFEIRSPKRLQIKFQEGSISPPQVAESSSSSSGLPSFDLFGQTVDLSVLSQSLKPLQEVANSVVRSLSGLPPLKFQLGQAGAQSWLLTTYLDEDIRISRGDGGGLFVLIKDGSAYQY